MLPPHFGPEHPHHRFIQDLLHLVPQHKEALRTLLEHYVRYHWAPDAVPFVVIVQATLLDGLPCACIGTLRALLRPERVLDAVLEASYALLDLADAAPRERYRVQHNLLRAFESLWQGLRHVPPSALASRACRWPALRGSRLMAHLPIPARDFWRLLYGETDINLFLALFTDAPLIQDRALARELARALVQRLTDIGRRMPHARTEPFGHDMQLVLVRLGASYDTELALFHPLREAIEAWMQAANEKRWYPRGNMQFITSLSFAYRNSARNERIARHRATLLVFRRLSQRHGLSFELLMAHVPIPPLEHDAALMRDVQRLALRFY
jgi:hypothetical protein